VGVEWENGKASGEAVEGSGAGVSLEKGSAGAGDVAEGEMAGRRAAVRVTRIRELTRAEVDGLTERPKLPVVQRIRDTHHMVARLFAMGLSNTEVAARTGFSVNRVSMFRTDPAMENLTIEYRVNLVDPAVAAGLQEFAQLGSKNLVTFQRMMSDHLEELEEVGERPSLRDMIAGTADLADRFGFPKRSINTQVNLDFATQLDKAIHMSGSKLKLVGPPASPKAADRADVAPTSSSEVVPLPLKRRI